MSEKKRGPGRPPKNGVAAIPGNPRQFRLSDETLADLDAVREFYGLTTRTDAIRLLARRGAAEVRRRAK